MEQSVVIRHVSGTKRPAVEQIPIAGRKELIAGRGPACDIRYDLAADDLVSRRHMKIEIAGTDTPEFAVVDLNSRNGTFINKRRIRERSKLLPGDMVQLGSGGPEFVFDLDPPNPETAPAEKTTAYNPISQERTSRANPEPSAPSAPALVAKPPERTSGWRRSLILIVAFVLLGSAAIVLVSRSRQEMHVTQLVRSGWSAVAAEGTIIARAAVNYSRDSYHRLRSRWQRSTTKEESAQNKKLSPLPASTMNADSLANLEVGWMLLDARSGHQLRQVYIDNAKPGGGVETPPLVPNAGRSLPLFVLLNNNRLQPVLTVSDDIRYRPIGGIYRNPGFLASSDGLILTNRRIAVPWAAPYEWPSDAAAGIVAKFDTHLKLVNTGAIARRQFPQWLPLESQFILADSLNAPSLRLITTKVRLDGRTDYLTVSLGNELRRGPARVVRTSDHFDLAVIRLDPGTPGQQFPAARLRDASECAPGDPAVLLSAAGASSPDGKAKSGSECKGRVVALRHNPNAGVGGSHSTPDRYELAVDPGRVPEPGAPVFDAQGRVFAIETAADPLYPMNVFAIPIRYGVDLLAASRN